MSKDYNELLRESTKGKTKEIAYNMGCNNNTIVREMDGSIKYNFMVKGVAFMNASDDDAIIQELAASQGGVFVVVPDIKPGGEAVAISSMVKEFGELLSEIGESKRDGKIDKSEVVRMRKELTDFIAVAEAFLICAERGDYDE